MAPFLPYLLQIYIQAIIMQRDQIWMGDSSKERENIFTNDAFFLLFMLKGLSFLQNIWSILVGTYLSYFKKARG